MYAGKKELVKKGVFTKLPQTDSVEAIEALLPNA